MTWTPDTPTTEQLLAAVLSSTLPALPPQEQHLGATLVSWWETDPGEVYIHIEGGTPDDRHHARAVVGVQLEGHGYTRTQFDLDVIHPESRWHTSRALEPRVSSWPDLMAKAKRLIMSGQVHVLRNGYNHIVGHVIGDHGEYDTEIGRDDPNTRAITSWTCTCPWDQYAWQRTRKWKKFEGRPCSHALALYWKALSTPLDEQLSEEQAMGMGTGQKIGPSPDTHEFGIGQLPKSFGPEGDILQGDQQKLNLPPDALGGPAQAPLAPPPGQGPAGPTPPGVLPPFPGEQMQWAGPGTTPGGGISPPGAYSVPGAKPPNQPPNPVQNPGTYSKVADFQPPQVVRLKKSIMGLAEGPTKGQYGDGEYREIPAGATGEVLSQDPTTGWIEIIVPLDDSGPHEPFHVRCFVEPSDIEPTTATNAFIRRR